jgi:protein ImuB
VRVACVAVSDLALQAWRRTEPELCRAPVAITDGKALTSRVVQASEEARALGVRLGVTAAQARAVAPSLAIRPIEPMRIEAARAALTDAAFGIGARVEPGGERDEVLLEIGDLNQLFEGERAVARALEAGCRAVGLAARVGIASSKGVARLAARSDVLRGAIVPAGGEAVFVAELPVRALEPSEEASAALKRWGVRTCGRLAALPAKEVALRLGREGERLARLAAGRCDEPFKPRAPTVEVEEGVELDDALVDLEALGFVLRGLFDRALARLSARHLSCAGVALRLHLEPKGYDVREIGLGAPTREVETLLSIVRLAVEKRPPGAGVVGVTVLMRAARGVVSQLDLFRPSGPAPDRLAATVARLTGMVGEGRVGRISPVDSWRDETFAVSEFRNGNGNGNGNERLMLRRFRPAREVEVLVEREAPTAMQGNGISTRVIVAAGPYRSNGEWWGEEFARDHWDVHGGDGALYRIVREGQRWFVEGYYD